MAEQFNAETYTPPTPETGRERARRKFLEEPLVPLGIALS